MENNRKKIHNDLEVVQEGFANGVAPGFPLDDKAKAKMIEKAAKAYGQFLTALGCDWKNDPNSSDTPRRIAKKYVLEQWKGRYDIPPAISSFPSDGFRGMVVQTNIPLTSMCSHHHETITGRVHIAYIPGDDARVIGLSKLNRLVEHFGRRGAIQEQLTVAIHSAVNKVCEGNIGVAVSIVGEHNCVSCRGTNHKGSAMVTSELTGVFREKPEVRDEYFKSIEIASHYKLNS
ncbi:GTP cyclohydrolase I [Candidatus Pelagibacter sp.]|nr:GTP cyclohydrolase I [Candidatus Pelagibacter sp.]